ncbi:MAG TPA: hypothetical protein VGM21_11165 [Actinomycetota bacterium]
MSDLLDLRVIGTPQATTDAVFRLPELFEVDRQHGPYPSRKHPGHVRYYLTARLRPRWTDQPPLAQVEDRKAARDLAGELAAITGHWTAMESQPWWPPQPGDVAVGHPDPGGPDPYGATFLAVAWPRSGGAVRFRVVSSTAEDDATPHGGYSIEELWFECPAVSVVRAGTIFPPTRRGVRP